MQFLESESMNLGLQSLLLDNAFLFVELYHRHVCSRGDSLRCGVFDVFWIYLDGVGNWGLEAVR